MVRLLMVGSARALVAIACVARGVIRGANCVEVHDAPSSPHASSCGVTGASPLPASFCGVSGAVPSWTFSHGAPSASPLCASSSGVCGASPTCTSSRWAPGARIVHLPAGFRMLPRSVLSLAELLESLLGRSTVLHPIHNIYSAAPTSLSKKYPVSDNLK